MTHPITPHFRRFAGARITVKVPGQQLALLAAVVALALTTAENRYDDEVIVGDNVPPRVRAWRLSLSFAFRHLYVVVVVVCSSSSSSSSGSSGSTFVLSTFDFVLPIKCVFDYFTVNTDIASWYRRPERVVFAGQSE
jgi:hypothetical protein